MEFPHLGQHCSESSCNKLDFLPVKCDACGDIFCHEHMSYASHNCLIASTRNVQVPVCPLCNAPVPSKRGEMPDIAVGAHIDRDCQSDPAKSRRKVFTNKCNLKGCKKKELIPMICPACNLNFCIIHRLTADHGCTKGTQNQTQHQQNGNTSSAYINSVHGGDMSEDEALAMALALSLEEHSKPSSSKTNENSNSLMNGGVKVKSYAGATQSRKSPTPQDPPPSASTCSIC